MASFLGPSSTTGLGGAILPSISLGPGKDQLIGLLQNPLSTWSSHSKHWSEWLQFVRDMYKLDRESGIYATLEFIANMHTKCLCFSLAKKKLSGVSFMLKLLG